MVASLSAVHPTKRKHMFRPPTAVITVIHVNAQMILAQVVRLIRVALMVDPTQVELNVQISNVTPVMHVPTLVQAAPRTRVVAMAKPK